MVIGVRVHVVHANRAVCTRGAWRSVSGHLLVGTRALRIVPKTARLVRKCVPSLALMVSVATHVLHPVNNVLRGASGGVLTLSVQRTVEKCVTGYDVKNLVLKSYAVVIHV